jgi:hypothetical protein
MNSATCPAPFTIKQPHPPEVSCSINMTTMAPNQAATITMTASSPDGRPLTYSWVANGGQLASNGATATLTALNTDAGKTLTATGTASDDRNPPLSASCSSDVSIPPAIHCVKLDDWGECKFTIDPKRPVRVDNDCKDILDKLAGRLVANPNGKLDIVGYTGDKEDASFAAKRAANIKYYLTMQASEKIDPSRVQVRQGGASDKLVRFTFVPEGELCKDQTEPGTVVDETQVKGQERIPLPQRHHKGAKGKAKPAPGKPESGSGV